MGAATSQGYLELAGEPIGEGRERTCYTHPDFDDRVIKVSSKGTDKQSERELKFYRDLERRGYHDPDHVPKFFGTVETNLGRGLVVEKICDWNGPVSRTMASYLGSGCSLYEFEPYLHDLRRALFDDRLLINHDLVPSNLFFRKLSPDQARLVIIDGMGDVVSIQFFNRFDSVFRPKLERRWGRFIRRLYHNWHQVRNRPKGFMESEYQRKISDRDYEMSIGHYLQS